MPSLPETQPVSEWETFFDKQFYGELNAIDDVGGFDAKPYIKDFIKKALIVQAQHLLQRVEDEVIGLNTGVIEKDNMGNDIVVYGKSGWHTAQNQLRDTQREKLALIRKEIEL